MAQHHSHSVEFKRQVAQKFISGETLHSLAKRRDLSRNLTRIWVRKYEPPAQTFRLESRPGQDHRRTKPRSISV